MENEESFCGCCGRSKNPVRAFCADCDKHVLQSGDPWKQTFLCQYGEACPYQVPEKNLLENDEIREMSVNSMLATMKL